MTRKITFIALLALALAACAGGGSSGTTTTTSGSSTTGSTEATTTTAATTTTEDASAARIAAAQQFEGRFEGEWRNTTFGSTGPAVAEVVVDAAAKVATFTLDLGGNVFGASDPDPVVTDLDLTTDGPWEGTNDLLGDYTIMIDTEGHLTLTAPSVPGLGMEMVVEGDLDPDGFQLTYTISNAGGVFAEGVVDVAPAG